MSNIFQGYSILPNGVIISGVSGNEIKPYVSKIGYLQIKINLNGKSKHFYVHRLIAEEFIPNPNKLKCVNHKDGNKLNNKIDNLEWCTYSQNNQHAYDNLGKIGAWTGKFSKNNPSSKPVAQYDKQGVLIKQYFCAKDATIETNFTKSGISECANHKTKSHMGFVWKFIDEVDNV